MRFRGYPFASVCAVGLAAWLTPAALGAGESRFGLALGTGSALQSQNVEVPLSASSSGDVQGLVAVFEWDGGLVHGVDLTPAASLEFADLIVRRVERNFMVLGVVIDDDGSGPHAIPAANDIPLATAVLRCLPGIYDERNVPLRFRDGTHSAVRDGPTLDNVLIIAGESFGREEGLELFDGQIVCTSHAGVEFAIGDGRNDPGSACGAVDVHMSNPSEPVEGFVLAIAHPAGLRLDDIVVEGTATAEFGADFVQPSISAQGGTLGVVLDLVSPLDGNVIPPGGDRVIARFVYCCLERPVSQETPIRYDLRFVDGVLGDPVKDNIAVIGGISGVPMLRDGSFTCTIIREICDDRIDNDQDGRTDCDDEDCETSPRCRTGSQTFALGRPRLDSRRQPLPLEARLGGTVELGLFYNSPEDFVPGGPQFDQVQGLSMVVCYPCQLGCREDSLVTSDTIVGAVDADFVDLQCDNNPNDGDGCELILGILVDALPPFDGRTLPPTDDYLRLASVTFDVADDDAVCGRDLAIEFCDGANGRGNVPLANLVATENISVRPRLLGTTVRVLGGERFFRGDCDFNRRINVSDAANVVLTVFGTAANPRTPPCLDACDCNDDGRVDFADTICILRYLFLMGRAPLPPGPGFDAQGRPAPSGEDPTADFLDCRGGGECSDA